MCTLIQQAWVYQTLWLSLPLLASFSIGSNMTTIFITWHMKWWIPIWKLFPLVTGQWKAVTSTTRQPKQCWLAFHEMRDLGWCHEQMWDIVLLLLQAFGQPLQTAKHAHSEMGWLMPDYVSCTYWIFLDSILVMECLGGGCIVPDSILICHLFFVGPSPVTNCTVHCV